MTNAERIKTVELITGLGELLNRALSPIAADLYLRLVDDLPFPMVEKAVVKLGRNCKFMPAPAEVREAALGPEENYNDTAQVEAAKVVTAVRHIGAYRDVVFDNPVTMAVIQQGFGGWDRLCRDLTEDQDQWFRKDFAKTYVAYLRSGIRCYGLLYGITSRTNTANGFSSESRAPVLVGNTEKAMQVMAFKPAEGDLLPREELKSIPARLLELAQRVGGYGN